MKRKKRTVDYFPHNVTSGKTIFALEKKYGDTGYAVWFRLLELLGKSDSHFVRIKSDDDWEFLVTELRASEHVVFGILMTLGDLGAINHELLEHYVVWSDNFVENLSELYKRRSADIPTFLSILDRVASEKLNNNATKPSNFIESRENDEEIRKHSPEQDPQGPIVKESILNNIKYIVNYLNEKTGREYRYKTPITQNYIKARMNQGFEVADFEKVINNMTAAWLENPKMENYLRPITLFGTKFESYLNYKNAPKKGSESFENIEYN